MKSIPVGPHFAYVDDEDYEKVIAYGKWIPLRVGDKVYAKHDWKAHGTRGTYLMHRFVMGVYTTPGNSSPVDHIDHDGLNNQKLNLRVTTKSINSINRKGLQANNQSGVHGVYWSNQKQKWHAEITRDGKKIHVGFFTTIAEAEQARNQKELSL